MLVLNRKIDEEIYIETPEGRITVKVVGIDGRSVKLGMDAPGKFPIYREELYRQVHRENIEAAADKEKIKKIGKIFGDLTDDDR